MPSASYILPQPRYSECKNPILRDFRSRSETIPEDVRVSASIYMEWHWGWAVKTLPCEEGEILVAYRVLVRLAVFKFDVPEW